ncbi:MAG: hypothetical protein LC123_14205 [Burkholderiales bacterium]|nr:hypothetical protein [Rhodocyclaceae bacterium]MCZ2175332.1 hypothetical protein [Burkholderiales bacterium]MCZ2420974.1 hypothetical protein [Burkholderiales bacterium]
MILLNVRLLSELPLVMELARRLKSKGEALAICAESETDETKFIRAAASELHARYYNMESLTMESAVASHRSLRIWAWLRKQIRNALSRATDEDDPQLAAFVSYFSRQIEAAHSILRETKPSILIVVQDGVSGNCALIRAARDQGVPVADFPYGFGTSRDFNDYIEEKNVEGELVVLDGSRRDWIERNCPQWIRSSPFGDVLMFPPAYIQAREKLGLSLELPWVVHGGQSDLLAAESPIMYRHYLEEGIRPGKVKLVGTLYCDVIYDVLAGSPQFGAAYRETRKIRPGHTSVLISLPPSYHKTRPGKNEFATYEAACAAIVKMVVSCENASGMISLHPTASSELRRFVKSLGLPVVDEWIIPLIPQCDIMLTTFSSTIRWAIACGKPVLNYNMYGYRCHDYDNVDGVITSPHLEEIRRNFVRLTNDGIYSEVALRQKEDGKQWGMIDGSNFDRAYQAINDIRQSSRQKVDANHD